jgi:glutathione S-transferase
LNKPDWFTELAPLGEMPLLKIDKKVIFKANVICEFLNDEFPPCLHPNDNVKKACNRSWIEFAHELIMNTFFMSIAQTKEDFHLQRQKLDKKLIRLADEINNKPFFNGADFSLIDTAYAPLFMRLVKLNELYPLNILDSFPGISHWSDALLAYPRVKQSEIPDYRKALCDFLIAKKSYLLNN